MLQYFPQGMYQGKTKVQNEMEKEKIDIGFHNSKNMAKLNALDYRSFPQA